MKTIVRYILLVVALSVASVGYGQDSDRGQDLHRTSLIPYATAEQAQERSLQKQRYMQPITEWVESDGVLRGEFTFPFSWVERRVFLRVEGVNKPYELWVNGRRAGGSTNGYGATEYDVTKIAHEDKNSVELRELPSADMRAIECFDGGEPRPTIYVIAQPRVRVRDVQWRATRGVGGIVNADFSVVMHNATLGEKSSRLYYDLFLNDTMRLTGGYLDVVLGMYGVDTMRFGATVSDSLLWHRSSPVQLSLRLKNRIGGRDVEFYHLPVSLRTLKFDDGKYVINGHNEDVEWCDMSPCTTIEELAQCYDRGVRCVRFTAGRVDEALLDYCDAHGIYVAMTAPINSSKSGKSRRRGGNPSNDPSWRDEYVARTEQMIHTTKRHPSVVAYFLADDSANGVCLYESYLAAKRVATDRVVLYRDGGKEWNSDDNM